MFKRPHHQRIAQLLATLNSEFLFQSGCFFGGGTAIVLSLGEYRESLDVDFLCSSMAGYRSLRNAISNISLGNISSRPIELAHEVRTDRYGIRTFAVIDNTPIKIEFVNDGRINISGSIHPTFGVPTLSRQDMYAEKLLANADRYANTAVASRDAIDLAMLIEHWGPIPEEAWTKARSAYGQSIDTSFRKSIELLSNNKYLTSCLKKMQMEIALAERIPELLRTSIPSTGLNG